MAVYCLCFWKFSNSGYESISISWMLGFYLLSHYSDYARNIIGPALQIGCYLFTSILFNKHIGVLDLVFLFVIMFIFQVL